MKKLFLSKYADINAIEENWCNNFFIW